VGVALVVAALELSSACSSSTPATPSAECEQLAGAPHPTADSCDALRLAKAVGFECSSDDAFPTEDERLNEGRARFDEAFQALGADGPACLRSMITVERTDSAFLFRAACMLLDDHPSRESLGSAADALERLDLAKVQRAMWVNRVMRLALQDVDTTALAEKYLVFPNVEDSAPTPISAPRPYTLGRDYGAVFLVGGLRADRADDVLVRALRRAEPEVRQAAALAAAFAATPACFQALRRDAMPNDFPWAVRSEIARALTRRTPPPPPPMLRYSREQVLADLAETAGGHMASSTGSAGFRESAAATLGRGDVELVRSARRRSMTSVRFESFESYRFFTDILYDVIDRYDLYADERRGS
jgi:hypothetical protein